MEWICNLSIFLLQLFIDKSCWFPFSWPCNMYKNIMMTTTINKWEMITTSKKFIPFTTPLLIASFRNILEHFDSMKERESAFPTSRSIEITCVKHIYKNTKKCIFKKTHCPFHNKKTHAHLWQPILEKDTLPCHMV